jgi:hypothetical protein
MSAGVGNNLSGTYKFTFFLRYARYYPILMEVWRTRMPSHKPTIDTVGVANSAMAEMRVGIAAEHFIV